MTRRTSVILAFAALLLACDEATDPPAHQAHVPVIHVPTRDGASVALHRRALPGAPPVLLVHGISSNHHFWDLMPGRSLAQHLHAEGFDVWNMDLRGHGSARTLPDGSPQPAPWAIDHYGQHDLPAAIAHIQAATGQSQLGYVGHSMGGMVLAIHLATSTDPGLFAAVTVGSPLDFRDPDLLVRSALGLPALPVAIPTPRAAWVGARMRALRPILTDDVLYNTDAIAVDAAITMLERIVSPLAPGEVAQLATSTADGRFLSADGTVDYGAALAEVDLPMLLLAGRLDRTVTPDRVRAYHDALGSEDKSMVVLSRAHGFRYDYGHLDLGVGDAAHTEVFPRISAFLRSRAPDSARPADTSPSTEGPPP